MSTGSACLSVAVTEQGVFLKIAGRATFATSPNLKTLLYELSARGFRRFSLDLSDCPIMDSTFLGVMVGFRLKLQDSAPAQPTEVRLFNANARIQDALETMGVEALFERLEGPPPLAEYAAAPPVQPPSPVELAQTSLEAHKTLMSVSAANVPKFKDVVQFLAEDLRKLQGPPS